MSKSGWSYPPGCSGPPDEPHGPCVLCGEYMETCKCPDCPECGVVGCHEHIDEMELMELTVVLREAAQLVDAKRLATEALRFGGCFCPFL